MDSFKGKVTIKILNSTFEWRQWLGCGTYWIFPLLKHDTMVIYSFSISFNRGKIQKWGWKHILCQIYALPPPPFKRIILCKKTLYQTKSFMEACHRIRMNVSIGPLKSWGNPVWIRERVFLALPFTGYSSCDKFERH